jgi:hypothetical protein
MNDKPLIPIGRTEKIAIPIAGLQGVPAKVDTGAYSSSIWATNIREKDGKLFFTLLGPQSPLYTGQELSTDTYRKIKVENSFGQTEERYGVFLAIELRGRTVKATFTLANRGMKTYPALIGRRLLHKKFVVDVSQVSPAHDEHSQAA